MLDLQPENAAGYLGFPCSATALGGGVSNTVLLVEAGAKRLVLKQSLGKLRVEEDWFSKRERIFREASAMRQLAAWLPAGAVPEVLFEDRGNFAFAMSAAPAGAAAWKDLLLRGEVNPGTAAEVGRILGTMIQGSWKNEAMREEFGDQSVFGELRLDPYYRTTAARHPDLAGHFESLIRRSGSVRLCLVHGDWSPKNFLVSEAGVMAIDFEVIHFGDPSFDAAFLLNHLLLKSFHQPHWRGKYRDAALAFWKALMEFVPPPNDWFEPAVLEHLGALLLARVDGKSPAEYIQGPRKAPVRAFARDLILRPPRRIADVFG